MNNEIRMKKRQMLESLDYIDDDLISGVLKKIKPEREYADPVRTWRTPLKHSKIYIALAASLLLLAMASPLVSFFTYVVSNFTAGAGSGTSESIETEEVPYLQFSPDLEPLSQELVDEINEAFIPLFLDMTKDELLATFGENAEEKYDKRWRVIRNYDLFSPYYGTFGDCIIFGMFSDSDGSGWWLVEIDGYTFDRFTYVYVNQELYYLEDAYEKGLLTSADISLLAKRYEEYLQFKKENREMYPW